MSFKKSNYKNKISTKEIFSRVSELWIYILQRTVHIFTVIYP